MQWKFSLVAWGGVGLVLAAAAVPPAGGQPPPKYGPTLTRLYHARDYVRQHPAPDFWALIPYYSPQPNECSCSNATAAMVVNALRAERELHTDDRLVTAAGIVDKVDPKRWKDRVAPGGDGVSLDELAALLPAAFKEYGVPARVEVVRFPEEGEGSLNRLRDLLADNEKSATDIVVVNFLQSGLTGDPEGAVGHFAPVAAYDAAARRVLILDPDRDWYEPYWVPDHKLLAAMRTADPDAGKSRGLLRVSMQPPGE